MKVAYIGNYRHDFCTEVHLAREIESLGHEVWRIQEPPIVDGDKRHFLNGVEQTVVGAEIELVLFTRTWGLPPETTELWRRLEARGVTTASYHLDLYVGLERESSLVDDPFWTTQWVFTPDGNPESAQFFRDRGIRHVWIPPAVVSDECYLGNRRAEFDFDVVFVGSGPPYHPEWQHRTELLAWLDSNFAGRFRRFGGDTNPGPVRGRDLNDLYATARVVVGDSCFAHPGQKYWSDRPYETWGRGGALIFPKIDALVEQLGYPYPSWETGDWTGLGDSIDYALSNPDEWNEIRLHLHETVRARHTYRYRLAAAFAAMFELPDVEVTVEHEDGTREAVAVTVGTVEEQLDEVQAEIDASRGGDALLAPTPPNTPEDERLDLSRLELGSGYHPTDGYFHVDLNPNAPNLDRCAPAYPLPWIQDGEVQEIRAVDVLEHLPYRQTDAALSEWARVLAPGGELYVQVPDAETIVRWYHNDRTKLLERLPDDVPKTPEAGMAWRLLGGQDDGEYAKDGDDWRWNAHYALFSQSSLNEALFRAGFTVTRLETNGHPNLLVWAQKR